jgi:type I restriction enzyme R subunit
MMAELQAKPEQIARVTIDEMLEAAGWVVQDYKKMDLTAGIGIAVREFPTKTGPVDYMLFAGEKAIGTVEAKKPGTTLLGIEAQSERYVKGFQELLKTRNVPHWGPKPLPFAYQTTGVETKFTSWLDPIARPRDVFHFHLPETLIEWVQEEESFRRRIRSMPRLEAAGLRKAQVEALTNLEKSLREGRPKALINMTMGSGKTFVAIAEAYRLLRHARARRVLFLVDRINLGQQAYGEFANFVTPDDGRKFTELYNVQVLRSNTIDPAAKVVITTIQRLYSILRGERELDPELEERSAYDLEPSKALPPVEYSIGRPIETFDVCFIDECHRSIYGKWGSVLDYFDMFKIGLTATAERSTILYFDENVVTEYKHQQAVADGVNVPYTTYRIRTEVTERGGTIGAGEWVDVRSLDTRRRRRHQLEDEVTYDKAKLDRAVVVPSQIRAVVRAFKEKICTEIFPGRPEVPKTVFFCKNDSHAEDVLQIIREEFGRGSEFARKITYKTEGDSQAHIQDFRTDPRFRIAVSVDQIATGTDIRPLECLVFMRMVGSRTLFEQMKGRGVRTIDPSDLQAVSEGATSKERFVIIDCVGLTDEEKAWVETRALERKPTIPLARLLQDVAMGVKDEETVSSIGVRLARLGKGLTEREREDFEATTGVDMAELAERLIEAADPDTWNTEAAARAGIPEEERDEYEPEEGELQEVREEIIAAALAPLMEAEVREAIETIRRQHEQIIDLSTADKVTFAGWVDADEAHDAIKAFEQFVKENHDEYLAIKAYYQRPYRLRPDLKDLKELAEAISKPPLGLTPEKLWAAYEALEPEKVKGKGMRRTITDLVQLIRFALDQEEELLPRREVVMLRFDIWLAEQEQVGREFTPEQRAWLRWMAEHIANSMSLELPDDLDLPPFAQEGGLLGAHATFGEELTELVEELNRELAGA